MHKLALALAVTAALALPALAQKKEEPKKEAAKVAIPANTFFKGQTASQYMASERLIGAKVVNKDGQTVGTIDDLILTTGNQVEGVVMGVGGFLGVGEKKVGVRIGALRITTADGRTTVTLPGATKEMLSAVPAYQYAGAAPPPATKKK
jgi:sporulation protein YlmC with PRC-barrel domain